MTMQTIQRNLLKIVLLAIGTSWLLACSSVNEQAQSQTEELRQRYEQLASREDVRKHAPLALDEAEEAVVQLEKYTKEGVEGEAIDSQIKLTESRLDTVGETVRYELAKSYIDNADSKRKDVLLQARTNETIEAQRKSRELEMRAKQAERKVDNLQSAMSNMSQQAKELQNKVESMEARETERGLILSLHDVHFETNKSKLMPGYENSIEELSKFLKQYPEHKVMVEGHTDSTGEKSYNEQLSLARAETVKSAILDNGVKADRVEAEGKGESFPIATNSTKQGRQLNRRVDIVISDPSS